MATPAIQSPLNAIIAALLDGQIVFQQGDIDKTAIPGCALAANVNAPPVGGIPPLPFPPPAGQGPPPPPPPAGGAGAGGGGGNGNGNKNLTRAQIGNFFEVIQGRYQGAASLLANYAVNSFSVFVQTPAVGTQFVVLSLLFSFYIHSVEFSLNAGSLTYDVINPNTGTPLGAPGILTAAGSPITVAVNRTAATGGTLAVAILSVAGADGLTITFRGRRP